MVKLPGRYFFRNLVTRRALLYELIRRDFERRFVGSAGGWLWAVIHPLVLLLSYTFVFSVCLRMTVPPGEGTSNYTLFLFCGYLPWMLFQDAVQRSASSLLESTNLITKTVFPTEMIPISIFFSSLINHALTVGIALAAVGFWAQGIGAGVILLPVYALLLGMLAIGIGWIVSAFQVYLRDTAQMVIVALTLWFWITPIFISETQVPQRLRALLRWNPLTGFVRGYRDALLTQTAPRWEDLAYLAVFSVAMFIVGGLTFRHLKRGFADVL